MNLFRRTKSPEYYANLESAATKVLDALLASNPTTTQSDEEWKRGYKFSVMMPPFATNLDGTTQSQLVKVELPSNRFTNYWSLAAEVPLTRAEAATRDDLPRVLDEALKDFDIRRYDASDGKDPQVKRNKKAVLPLDGSGVWTYTQPFATPHDPETFVTLLKRNLPEIKGSLHDACMSLAPAAGMAQSTSAAAGRG
jgi:hypothetical protein